MASLEEVSEYTLDDARQFAEHVAATVSPRAARAFDALTESYLAQRFGEREPLPSAAAQLATLASEIHGSRSDGASPPA